MTPLELMLILQLGTVCGFIKNDDELNLRLQISCIAMRHRAIEPGNTWPWEYEYLVAKNE